MPVVVVEVVQIVTGLLIVHLEHGVVFRQEVGEETSQWGDTKMVSQVTGTATVLVTLLNSVLQVLHS